MMFLIRTAFWLTIVILMIPVDETAVPANSAIAKDTVGAIEAVGAAQAAITDVGGFCGRNPDVCDVGGRVATTLALKARTGTELLADFLDGRIGAADARTAGTLTPADLEPVWRGPTPEPRPS